MDAAIEQVVADLARDAEAGGGVLGVGDHQVDAVMVDEAVQSPPHELTPGSADDIADEEDVHRSSLGPVTEIRCAWPRRSAIFGSTIDSSPSRTDAVARLNQLGSDIGWGSDLGGDDETLLAKEYDRPVFVYNYPRQVKAFYMKENPEDPRTVLNNDCLAPEGYGEIIGGSQREDDYDRLLARIHEQGLDPEAYRWYLDLRRYGTFVHSGFGLGIERTVAWICGIQHIREAIAFPRQIHRLYP